jgi:hypothetical protein
VNKVLVNSLPKSGTHLAAHCLELFGFNSIGHISSRIVLRNDWQTKIRRILFNPLSNGYIVGVDSPIEISRWIIDKRLNAGKKGTYITSHVGYTDLILNKSLQLNYKPLLIIRDPRAVLNSFVHYVSTETEHSLFNEFNKLTEAEKFRKALNGFCSDTKQLQSIYTRCLAVESWRKNNLVLTVKFEDLIGAQGGGSDIFQKKVLNKICEFVGGDERKIENVANNLFGSKDMTFRKGKVDSWKREIPHDLHHRINMELEDILSIWGYK